ncbi:16S rRNA (guanine(527)-N(7))-methyltransferase RsmG [Psychrobacter sp. M13]|uniref:16S rRNA (guanine(527)-N(7))-methyltransferase RsmG n=1 Tax=Psychrobacter sp. M13 TaxID=3067275 RepID=UPI00273CB0CC|nr:16S rRNA (guanine(527)-N(7))-methyltransferase RsmG [Psychrobacter sp. M13]WLP93505.1 16S rRNA (guanine(527)-N(7))-methyltransferase RsmG [Psychrobacter sp. M13]
MSASKFAYNSDQLADPTGFVKLGAQLPDLAIILVQAIQELDLSLTMVQQRKLLLYLDQLLLWSKTYNLTAITDPQEALIKHVIDCLAIITHLPAGNLLDIGTGAGLPAVIIAICQPERQCSALDSNQKKIRFIKQVSSELGLDNIQPIAARIEAHEGQYKVVTSRAFASLTDFVAAAQPRLASDGYLCAMKGKEPTLDELQALEQKWQIRTIKLKVPRLEDSRHLIELTQKALA